MKPSCWATSKPNPDERLAALSEAIRRVYASTFSRHAKAYVRATPYRLEEEKMAVILQQVVGTRHGERFYPDFSGVVRSRNFYPVPPMTFEDGIAAVALGLGRAVVDGGKCLTFLPALSAKPGAVFLGRRHTGQLADRNSGPWSWTALRKAVPGIGTRGGSAWMRPRTTARCGRWLRRTPADNHAVYDGVSRPGARIVTFAPMLKHGTFPLAEDSG